MGDCIITRKGGKAKVEYVYLAVTTNPTKMTYNKGENFDTTGMVVTAVMSDGTSKTVTGYTYSPTTLTAWGNATITISYTEDGITKTTTLVVNVTPTIVTWANGTDAEIANMVDADRAGLINLQDYWAVGDTRTVTLSAMSATGVGESHASQSVELVLMDSTCTGFTYTEATSSGRTTPRFMVGQRDCLNEKGYMRSNSYNNRGWSTSSRRTWCNSIYKNAIPSTLRSAFKQFTWQQGVGGGESSGLVTTSDFFGLAPEKAVCGIESIYSFTDERALYSKWRHYNTFSNRIKKINGSADAWWGCSPRYSDTYRYCAIDSEGNPSSFVAEATLGLAPFGVI